MATEDKTTLSAADKVALHLAERLLKDEPCCSAGLALVHASDGLWRVKPSGQEYTLGVGDSPAAAIKNAVEAALGADDDDEDDAPEVTPEMREAAQAQADELREHGVECTADEIILASFVSNLVETTLTLKPELKTRALTELHQPQSVVHCLVLARMVPEVLAAKGPEQQAAAVAKAVVGVFATLTQSHARKLSKLGKF